MRRIAAPVGAPAANYGDLWFQADGAGKLSLMVRFPTGPAQAIAVEA